MNIISTLLAKIAKSSLGAMISIVPAWLWYALIALSLLITGGWINGTRWQLKYNQHLLADKTAQATAIQAQANANTAAASHYIPIESAEKAKVTQRTNEVKVYVHDHQNTTPRLCAPNDLIGNDFVRLYNNDSTLPKTAN